jgi:hypothetical protein
MARNLNVLFLFQMSVAFWMLLFVSVGFVAVCAVWALFYLQESRDRKRPGISLREL